MGIESELEPSIEVLAATGQEPAEVWREIVRVSEQNRNEDFEE